MAEYIIGAVIVAAVILALRSHFGSKYGDSGCCSGCSGCSGCSRVAQCGLHAKETVDKSVK